MGTRVCSCIRVRSRAGADDALIRGMRASALHRRTDQRCWPAAHMRPRAASVHASACVCDWAPPYPRRHMRARSAGGGPRAARLAGVLCCVEVQREHRLVERPACEQLRRSVRRSFFCGLHQARRVRQLGVHLSNGGCIIVPVVELAPCVHSVSDCVAVDGHAEVLMPERLCVGDGVQVWLGPRH